MNSHGSARRESLLLAIDFGSQSVRAVAVAQDGGVAARASVELDAPDSPHPGWAEQDADYLWRTLCAATNALLNDNTGLKTRLAAVALTTQRACIVVTDANGRALRPAIMWPDERQASGVPPVAGLNGLALRTTRMSETVRYFQSQAEVNWLAVHEPDVWARSEKVLLLSGFLTWRLVDECTDSAGAQVGYVPFDFRRLRWAGRRNWKWQALPALRRAQLPDLRAPGVLLGSISARAASESGLPAGLPLIASAADKACEVLGSGTVDRRTACLSYGTAATVNVPTDRYVEAIPYVPPYPAAAPGTWNAEIQVSRGFWLVDWFKREFAHPETALAAQQGIAAEVLIDELLERAPPGAGGLVAQPYFSPGIKIPGPEARGVLLGFASDHTRAHMYRALLEGIAFAMREGMERIERRARTRIETIRVAGGGSRSDAVMQLTADVFGLPAARPRDVDTSALGAAINAAVGIGLHADYPSAVRAMTHVGDVFDPHPGHRDLYEQLYRDIYLRIYPRLQPLYRRLHDILR